MKYLKKFEEWRAEQIAKVYLLSNNNFFTLLPSNDENLDFFLLKNDDFSKKIGVFIIPTKYQKSEIKKIYDNLRRNFKTLNIPIIIMYINYDNKHGFYEIVNGALTQDVTNIKIDEFKKKIDELINTN